MASTLMGDHLRVAKLPQYFTQPPRPTQRATSAGQEMSTNQSVVTLCGWVIKAGVAHSTCG